MDQNDTHRNLPGWIYDATGNYDNTFYLAGVPPLIGAVILFFIPKHDESTEAGTQAAAMASISHWSLYTQETSQKNHGQYRRPQQLNLSPTVIDID